MSLTNRSFPRGLRCGRSCRRRPGPLAVSLIAFLLGLLVPCPPAAAAPAAPSAARAGAFTYRLELRPERPLIGSPLYVTVRVEGLTAASLANLELSPGLGFGSSLVKPWSEAAGGAEETGGDAGAAPGLRGGTELRLELNVLAQGPWTIDSLVLEGREGKFAIGPLRFEAGYPGTKAAAPPAWRWKAPESAYRYSAVAVSLEGPEAAGRGGSASLSSPSGAALEAVEGSNRSWLLIPLAGGSVLLPETRVECGSLSGKAPARRIEILALPAEIESTKAQGEFGLSFVGPEGSGIRPGDLLSFRLVLRGTGNLPSVRFPSIVATLNGKALPSSYWRETRTDSIAPTSWGYEGAAILELSMEAPGPGRLRLAPAAFPVLRPDGIIETLGAPPVEVVIKAAGSASKKDPLALLIPDLAKVLSARDKSVERLPRLVSAGRYDAALELLGKAPGPLRAGEDGLILEAALSWAKGSRGEALATIYGLARRAPGEKRLTELSAALQSYMDAGPALRDTLPSPRLFWGLTLAVGMTGLAIAAVLVARNRGWAPRRRIGRGREGRAESTGGTAPHPALLACAGFLLMAALALACFAVAADSQRNREFAVVWADKVLTVPSALSEGSQPLRRGASAFVVGRAPGYVGLRFEDGVMGWVDEKSVYSY